MSQGQVDVSLTARQKEFRYLSLSEIQQYAQEPPGDVFYDSTRDRYLVRVKRWRLAHNGRQAQQDLFIIVSLDEDGGLHVVTQTSDHYDLGQYDRVDPPWT